MKEFMLYIRNRIDHLAGLTPTQNQEFLEACRVYIEKLQKEGKLIAAQPIEKQGILLSVANGEWKEAPFNETNEVNVGYYHIRAIDLNEAIAIAKENPEFVYTKTARIEVRPIKGKETSTGFEYPKGV